MTFFKTKTFSAILMLLLIGCSANVEDKNSGLSNSEKKDLSIEKDQETLEVTSIGFESANDIREDLSEKSNIISKYYTLKVCLKDKKMIKGLANRTVHLDGEANQTDTNGCVYWDHEIKIDHKDPNKCKVFEKEIKFSNNKTNQLKYSIDYLNNEITNLKKSRGCVVNAKYAKKGGSRDPIVLRDVFLTYGNRLTKRRSDIRHINHETKIKSCIEVRSNGKPLVEAQLKITATNLETGEVSRSLNPDLSTNTDGCFSTEITSKYEQYRNSHWMEIDLKIEILSGPLAGTSTGRSVYINPWESSRLHYGIGEEGKTPVEVPFKDKYARLHMDGVMYIQIGNDTKKMTVNNYLGLTIAKTYQVVLNPYIDREHKYTEHKRAISRLLHEGKFKLSMVVLAPKDSEMAIDKGNFENFEYITGVEQIVTIKNGIINAVVNIPFKMTDIPRLAVRTMSVFRVEPIDDTGLQSSVVTGFFKARIPWIKTNVLQSDALNIPKYADKTWKMVYEGKKKKDYSTEEIDQTCSEIKGMEAKDCVEGMKHIQGSDIDSKTMAYRGFINNMFSKLSVQTSKMNQPFETKISPKRIFENHLKKKVEGIKILSASQAAREFKINIKKSDFNKVLPKNKTISGITNNVAEQICRYAFTKDGEYEAGWLGIGYSKIDYDECSENPSKYFGIKALRHVDQVKKIGNAYPNGFTITVGENLSANQSENDTETVSDSWYTGGDFGVKIPIIEDVLSLGLKAGYSHSWTSSHSENNGHSFAESIGTGKSLGVEMFTVDVKADFERCMLIVSKDYLNEDLASQRRAMLTLGGGIGSHKKAKQAKLGSYYKPTKNFNFKFYICDDETKEETFTESWYFIQSNIDSAVARDYDDTERKLIKVVRGNQSYNELRTGLRNMAQTSLRMDNVGYKTPQDVLVKSWGHLLGDKLSDKEAAQFLLKNVEGSFPGTIEGNGSTPSK